MMLQHHTWKAIDHCTFILLYTGTLAVSGKGAEEIFLFLISLLLFLACREIRSFHQLSLLLYFRKNPSD